MTKRIASHVLLALMTALSLAGCRQVPVTGRSQLVLISAAQETQLGEQAFQQVLQESTLSRDATANAILQRVGQRIAANSGLEGLKWEFVLIDSDQVNAFALPGGKVAVYTGILPICENEAGLAAVIGHEVSHVIARHGAERMSQGLVVELVGAGVNQALSEKNAALREGVMTAYGLGSQVGVLLPYSRTHETEADTIGVQLMARAGYDPAEAPRVWERMAGLGGQQPPQLLSTHPSHESRIRNLSAMVPAMRRIYDSSPEKHGLGARFPQ